MVFIKSFEFIDSASFNFDSCILLLTMVVIGGTGALAESVISPFLLLVLPRILTQMNISTTIATHLGN